MLAKRDYSSLIRTDKDGNESTIDSAPTNAVYFEMENGFVCIRPSGTEPKLKVYYSINAINKATAEKDFEKMKADFEGVLSCKPKKATRKTSNKTKA